MFFFLLCSPTKGSGDSREPRGSSTEAKPTGNETRIHSEEVLAELTERDARQGMSTEGGQERGKSLGLSCDSKDRSGRDFKQLSNWSP